LAKENGYKCCIAECTGSFSQRSAELGGFKEISSLTYKDFIYNGERVLSNTEEIHSRLVLYELML